MKTFKEFINENYINERYLNLFTRSEKELYANQTWNILQSSYEKIGGIKGSGFNNIDDMIDNIPMWKLDVKNGVVKAVKLYKDKEGRKSVAAGSDGTDLGKEKLIKIMIEDIKTLRTYVEISGAPISILKKYLPNYINYAVPFNDAKNKLKTLGDEIEKIDDDDKELLKFPELKDFFYKRKIGQYYATKVMFGNINADKIVFF
jgi:hypothetical protein